jgi:hypothetical protein
MACSWLVGTADGHLVHAADGFPDNRKSVVFDFAVRLRAIEA